jgi:hypothetical protein
MGLWSFDLAHIQIMQVSISEDERGIVNSTEKAFTTLAYMIILLVSVVFNDPKFFEYLMYVSLACVGLATFVFSFWTTRRSLTQVIFDDEKGESDEEVVKENEELEPVTVDIFNQELMKDEMGLNDLVHDVVTDQPEVVETKPEMIATEEQQEPEEEETNEKEETMNLIEIQLNDENN